MARDQQSELMQGPPTSDLEDREVNPAVGNEQPPEGKVVAERPGAPLPCVAPLFD